MTLRAIKAAPVIRVTLAWFDKEANRLPEALWLTFQPIAPVKEGWTLTKVEQPVSPFDVVAGGNRHMHAISRNLTYRDTRGSLTIETLDAPVIALGERSPIAFSKSQPDNERHSFQFVQQRLGHELHSVVRRRYAVSFCASLFMIC